MYLYYYIHLNYIFHLHITDGVQYIQVQYVFMKDLSKLYLTN